MKGVRNKPIHETHGPEDFKTPAFQQLAKLTLLHQKDPAKVGVIEDFVSQVTNFKKKAETVNTDTLNDLNNKMSSLIPIGDDYEDLHALLLNIASELAQSRREDLSVDQFVPTSQTKKSDPTSGPGKTEQRQETKSPKGKLFDTATYSTLPPYQARRWALARDLKSIAEITKDMDDKELNEYANSVKNSYESDNKGIGNALTHAWRSIFGDRNNSAAEYRKIKETETKKYTALMQQIREAPLLNAMKEKATNTPKEFSMNSIKDQKQVESLTTKLANGEQITPDDVKKLSLSDALIAYRNFFLEMKGQGKRFISEENRERLKSLFQLMGQLPKESGTGLPSLYDQAITYFSLLLQDETNETDLKKHLGSLITFASQPQKK